MTLTRRTLFDIMNIDIFKSYKKLKHNGVVIEWNSNLKKSVLSD